MSAASSESNIENEEGYQDAGEMGPDNSVFLAWWSWCAVVVIVICLVVAYSGVLAR